MKINAISFGNKKTSIAGQESIIKAFIIFSALFACGMILGAGIYRTDSTIISVSKNILDNFFLSDTDKSIFSSVISSTALNASILIILLISGFSCTGIPFIIFSVFFRGISYGIISGYLFNEYAMTGIGYYLIIILTPAVLLTSGFILFSIHSYYMSADLLGIISGKKQPDKKNITEYIIKTMPCVIMTITASTLGVILRTAFSGLFVMNQISV